MGLVVPEGFAEVVFQFEIPSHSGPAMCVFGIDNQPGASGASLLSTLQTNYAGSSSWGPFMDSEVILERIEVRRNEGAGIEVYESSPGLAGGRTHSTLAPPQVTYLVSKVTGFAGRSNRGRMYWPGVQADDIDQEGDLISGIATALQGAASTFRINMANSSLPLVVLHSVPGPAPRLVTSLVARGLVATQRRRLR